jgi:hypothetical protein
VCLSIIISSQVKSSHGGEFYAKARYHVEQKNNIVDIMLSVHNRKYHKKAFFINMYNTTSKVLVNGKYPNTFSKHLECLLNTINRAEIQEINETIMNIQPAQPENQIRRSNRTRKATFKMLKYENRNTVLEKNIDRNTDEAQKASPKTMADHANKMQQISPKNMVANTDEEPTTDDEQQTSPKIMAINADEETTTNEEQLTSLKTVVNITVTVTAKDRDQQTFQKTTIGNTNEEQQISPKTTIDNADEESQTLFKTLAVAADHLDCQCGEDKNKVPT